MQMQSVAQLVYPSQCLSCGDLVEDDFGLCSRCWRDTPFISGLVCDKCGVPLMGAEEGGAGMSASPPTPLCDDCMNVRRPWSRGRAALLYEGNGRKLVLALKNGDRQDLAPPAAGWMARAAQPLLSDNMLIAPVPLHWMRLMKRRYNQAALLGIELSRILQRAICVDLLQRPRRTRKLDGLGVEERFAMISGSIRVHPRRRHLLIGRSVLLIDDVMTSGATFAAAAETCLAAGARDVSVLALTRVAKSI